MHESQKPRKRESFLTNTTKIKAWQGHTSTAWNLLRHFGLIKDYFLLKKMTSPTNDQEGRHKCVCVLVTPINSQETGMNP